MNHVIGLRASDDKTWDSREALTTHTLFLAVKIHEVAKNELWDAPLFLGCVWEHVRFSLGCSVDNILFPR